MHLVDGSSGQQQRKEGEEALILSAEAWRVGRSKVRKKDLWCGLFCRGSQILVQPVRYACACLSRESVHVESVPQLPLGVYVGGSCEMI